MPIQGHATCAHCGALLSGDSCTICGKSVRDAVEIVDAEPRRRGMSDEGRRQVRSFGLVLVGIAIVGAGAFYMLTRETVEPTPTALATPDTTTTVEVEARVEDAPVVTRPGADAAPLPTLPVTDAAERDVGDGANPWDGAPPRNVLTGVLLENTDFAPGVAAIESVLAVAPTGFEFGPPATTDAGEVDLIAAEGTQPFAARSIADETGPIADVWIFARGSSTTDGSAAYLDAALARWPIDAPIDSFSPRPGIRIHQVSVSDSEALWVDLRDTWMLLYRSAPTADPALLGAISEGWG